MIVRNGRLETSYSQIDKFKKCPMQWHLRYIEGLKYEQPNKHLEYGLATHETLEFFFKEKQNGYVVPLELLQRVYQYNIDKRNIPFESSEEEMEYVMNGSVMIDNLLGQEDDFYKMLLNSEILGVEQQFELPVEVSSREFVDPKTEETLTLDTVWIKGFIDLVLRNEKGIILIDHKSGSKPYRKSDLKNNLQFPIYALAVKEIYGEYPAESFYNFTKIHKSQRVLFTEEITPEMEEEMSKRGSKKIYSKPPEDTLMEVRQVFNKMYKPKHKACPTPLCFWCEYGYYNEKVCKASSKWKPIKK